MFKICDFYLFVNFIRIISFNFIVSTLYFILGCVEIVCINFVGFFVRIFVTFVIKRVHEIKILYGIAKYIKEC